MHATMAQSQRTQKNMMDNKNIDTPIKMFGVLKTKHDSGVNETL
jgi:hypothetical protein